VKEKIEQIDEFTHLDSIISNQHKVKQINRICKLKKRDITHKDN